MTAILRSFALLTATWSALSIATAAHATDLTADAESASAPLEDAISILWRQLDPIIEQTLASGFGQRILEPRWINGAADWKARELEKHEHAKSFLLPLRTIIKLASCEGHPVALKALFRIRAHILLGFLTLEHRLLLEWRALHLGLTLPFLEAVRWRKPLPLVSSSAFRPTGLEIAALTPDAAATIDGEDQPDDSHGTGYDRLFLFSSRLRDRDFESVIYNIPALARLCYGIDQPDDDKMMLFKFYDIPVQYDPVELPRTSG